MSDCEEHYKRGGRVKAKKAKKGKKKSKVKGRKATGKRARGEALKYVPLGGALPTTGMSSTVFGAPQAPSYFRASLPQQEFANIPDVLKTLKEGQQTIMKEIEKRKAQEAADKVFAESIAKRKHTETTPPRSGDVTPTREFSWSVTQSPGFRPIQTTLSPLIGRLESLKLERQESYTPPIMTPMSEFAPGRAIPSTYTGPLSSREAMGAEPYRGADETLPAQPAASGQQMKPVDASHDASQPSAFVPLGASQPESVGDSAERASAVAAPASAMTAPPQLIPRPRRMVVVRPVVRKPEVEEEVEGKQEARPAPAPAPAAIKWYMRNPDSIGSRDELNSMASHLGIRNPKAKYTGPGSSDLLREDIKRRQKEIV